MTVILAWLIKFFSGFAIWKGQQFGKILFFSIISLAVVFGFWKIFLEKKISNIQHTEITGSNVTYQYQDCSDKIKEDAFSLIKLWRLRLLSIK